MKLAVLGLVAGTGPVSQAIRWRTWSTYSHVSVLRPDGRSVIEAWQGTPWEAVRRKGSVRHYTPTRDEWRRQTHYYALQLGDTQYEDLQRRLQEEIGQPYDYTGVLRFLSRRPHRENGRWFCSELAFQKLLDVGVPLLQRIHPWQVSPGHLATSPSSPPSPTARSQPTETMPKIGELNGPWSIALRLVLASYPLAVGWAVWVSKSVFELRAFANSGERFTLQDAYSLERRIDVRIDALPPADWREKIENLQRESLMLRDAQRRLENEFTRDFVRKDELRTLRDH